MPPLVMLSINLLRRDGRTQPRVAIDDPTADSYAREMKAGAHFPPVTVFHDGANYWLVDGFHRVRAVDWLGLKEIECDVQEGTLQEAQWFSYSANKTHGLHRSNEDKQQAVQAALAHPKAAGLSDRAIAEHVGVDHVTVMRWREKLQSTGEIHQSSARTGRDGRKRKVVNISKPQPKKATIKPSASRTRAALAQPVEQPVCSGEVADGQVAGSTPAGGSTTTVASKDRASLSNGKAKRRQRIESLAQLTLVFLQKSRHLAGLTEWLGEKHADFQAAETTLKTVLGHMEPEIAAIEQLAIAEDPANGSRLGIGL